MVSSGLGYYNTASIVCLIRFIRNTFVHPENLSQDSRKAVFEDFIFFKKFPTLVITVYEAVKQHGWGKRPKIRDVLNAWCSQTSIQTGLFLLEMDLVAWAIQCCWDCWINVTITVTTTTITTTTGPIHNESLMVSLQASSPLLWWKKTNKWIHFKEICQNTRGKTEQKTR